MTGGTAGTLATGGTAGTTSGGSSGTQGGAGTSGSGTGGVPGVTIIQEDTLGFSAIDGLVLPRQGPTSITGYTGTGFADSDTGMGKTISWGVSAETAGTYQFIWRYAFGGTATNLRDATLYVNGVAVGTITFAYTNTWNDWQETPPLDVTLDAGPNFIQLVAQYSSGLANIDYFEVLGEGITPDSPSFSLTLGQNNTAGGSVSYAPVQGFYRQGASITLTATANAGYFFQSWSGDVTSSEAVHTFAIQKNSTVRAIFLPTGTQQDPDLVGYAGVQDDQGTPYIVTGGSLGRAVTATTYAELKSYLESSEPLVVSFTGEYLGPDAISIASDKTLLGVGTAHLNGIELTINRSENVIVRNVAISHVVADGAGVANDAIDITGGSQHIWIDHCELYADLDHGKDYYDGLLDIKNGARFITISWTELHDHFKASLISSGDEQVGDAVIRITYHHDYFHNLGSRMPSIRFGKAHIFNNYYLNDNSGSCVNSRMGAVVKVESNYFENSQDAIGSWDSTSVGTWDVANNVFDTCTGSLPTTSTGSLTIAYPYTPDPVANVPAIVVAGAGVGKL
jgi:pectate lyase